MEICGVRVWIESEEGSGLGKERVEKVKRGVELVCDDCGKTLRSRDGLEYHINWHMGRRWFQCEEDDCALSFFGSVQLRQHIRRAHRGIPPKAKPPTEPLQRLCDHCPFSTTSRRALTFHARACPSDPRNAQPRVCDDCGAAFTKPAALASHVVLCRAKGTRPALDSSTASLDSSLDASAASLPLPADEGPLRCRFCDRRYPNRQKLKAHLAFHQGQSPPRRVCDVCLRRFNSAASLRYHLRNPLCKAPSKPSPNRLQLPESPPAAPGPTPPVPSEAPPSMWRGSGELPASFVVYSGGEEGLGPWEGTTAIVSGSLVPLNILSPLPGLPGHFTSQLGPQHLFPNLDWSYQPPLPA